MVPWCETLLGTEPSPWWCNHPPPALPCFAVLRWVRKGDGCEGFAKSISWAEEALLLSGVVNCHPQREGAWWHALAERGFGIYSLLPWLLQTIFKPLSKNLTVSCPPNPRKKKKKNNKPESVVSVWCNYCLEDRTRSGKPCSLPSSRKATAKKIGSFSPAASTRHGPVHLSEVNSPHWPLNKVARSLLW